jgi:hypothetical protein
MWGIGIIGIDTGLVGGLIDKAAEDFTTTLF